MKIKYVMAMAAVMFLSACSNDDENANGQKPESGTEEKLEGKLQVVEDEVVPFDAIKYRDGLTSAEQEVAQKIQEMDVRLCSSVMEGQEGNMVFSPYSLHQVLAMAMNAANDEAQSELMQQYGLSQEDLESLNAIFRKQRNLLAGQQNEYITMEVANKLWVDYSIPVFRSYMSLLQNFYDAETEAIDCFSKAGSSAVNRWVEDKTHGLIRDIAKPDGTGWYINLMNAIYMKASWNSNFQETKTMNFLNQDGSKTDVDMMHNIEGLRYAETNQGRILRVPFASRQYEVDFVLPSDGVGMASVLANLTSMISQCNNYVMVDVLLPKHKIYNEIELNRSLASNGLSAIFNGDATTRFSPTHKLHMDQILQHACIDFNENGIEAAAVTEGMETSAGGETEEKEIIPFHMDRPFLFFIRNTQCNSLLFVGKVCQMNK